MFLFDAIDMIFPIAFIAIIALILFTIGKAVAQWNANNHSPKLTVDATIVAKRTQTTHYHDTATANASGMHTTTTYYVTFEVESRDRMELHVSGQEYGMLAEGDTGKLTFQGTRYLGFERY